MQIRTDFSKEELLKKNDPLGNACYPFGRLKLVAEIFGAIGYTTKSNDSSIYLEDSSDYYSIREIITDAVNDIDYLIDISNEQHRNLNAKLKAPEVRHG